MKDALKRRVPIKFLDQIDIQAQRDTCSRGESLSRAPGKNAFAVFERKCVRFGIFSQIAV
jgi:hypothetical protein